jgi:DNA invertase Pin-like site-specific DNA recombinase
MGRTVGYVRVSTDLQDTTRQHTAIRLWAERNQTTIAEVYVDHGRRHAADRRVDFQRLFRDIAAGRVQQIVVDSQDRFGFQGPFEWYHYLFLLQKNTCKLISAIDGKVLSDEDPASFITTGIGAHASREEMVKKSSRDLGKKREMAKAGVWTGGWLPYGCDVVCKAADGTVRWRVVADGKWKRYRAFPDGRDERWDGKNSFPSDRRPGDILVLDRTVKTERLEIVRTIFRQWLEGWAFNTIAKHLNATGPECWHPHGPWYSILIKGILRNPSVIGRPAYNKNAHGLYSELSPDGQVVLNPPRHPNDPLKAKTGRRRVSSAWLMPDQAVFEPIVDATDFWKVQEIMNRRKPHSRAPKSDRLWLSGFLVCGKCQQRLSGWSQAGESYACSTFKRYGKHNPTGCRLHRVKLATIESMLDQYLADTGKTLESLTAGGESGLLPSLFRQVSDARSNMRDIRAQMEHYLMKALTDILEPVKLPNGQQRFELDTLDGPVRLDLPGCTDPLGLEFVYGWVASIQRRRKSSRIEESEAELARLYRQWSELNGLERARELVRQEMVRVEGEMDRLRGNDLDLGLQLRGAFRALSSLQVELARARTQLRSASYRARALALSGVLDRIVVWFEYRQHGQQLRSHLVSVDFEPLVGECASVSFREEDQLAPG